MFVFKMISFCLKVVLNYQSKIMARPVFQKNKNPSTRPIRFSAKFAYLNYLLQKVFKEIPKFKRSQGKSIKEVCLFPVQFDLPFSLVRRCPLLVDLPPPSVHTDTLTIKTKIKTHRNINIIYKLIDCYLLSSSITHDFYQV